MGKTFTAAQRAARKGKKRQQRKLTAKLHQAEFVVMKFGKREDALRVMNRVEKRERINKLKHHTRKAGRNNEGETQQN